MNYTLGKAAKATGKSKSTISNAIKKGRISASRDDLGNYCIDAAELHRVYPSTVEEQAQPNATAPTNSTLELEQKLAVSEAQLTLMREMIEELKSERDYLRQAQITHQQKPGILERLFKRSA